MLFSQRRKLAEECNAWCENLGALICFENCIAALQALGWRLLPPEEQSDKISFDKWLDTWINTKHIAERGEIEAVYNVLLEKGFTNASAINLLETMREFYSDWY